MHKKKKEKRKKKKGRNVTESPLDFLMTSIFQGATVTTAASGGQWTNVSSSQFSPPRNGGKSLQKPVAADLPASVKTDGRLDSRFLNTRSSPQSNGTAADLSRALASTHVSTPVSTAARGVERTRYNTPLLSPSQNTRTEKPAARSSSEKKLNKTQSIAGFRISNGSDEEEEEDEKKQPPREIPARVVQNTPLRTQLPIKPSAPLQVPKPSAPVMSGSVYEARPPPYNPATVAAATQRQAQPSQAQQAQQPQHDASSPMEDSPEDDASFPGPFDGFNRRLTDIEILTIMRVFVTEHNERVADGVDGDMNMGAFVNIRAGGKEKFHAEMACQPWNEILDSFKTLIMAAKTRDAYKQASVGRKVATNVVAASGAVASGLASIPGMGVLGAARRGLKSLVPTAVANVANNTGAKLQSAANTVTGGVFDTTMTADEKEDAVNRIMHDVPQMLAIIKSMNGEGKGTYAVCAFNPYARTFLIVDPFSRDTPNGECYIQMQQNMRSMLNDVFSSEDGGKLVAPTLKYSAFCMNIPLNASKVNGGIWALRLAQQLLGHNFDKDTSKHVQIDQYIKNLHKKDIKTSRRVYSKLLYYSVQPDDDDDADYEVRDEQDMVQIVKSALDFDGLVA